MDGLTCDACDAGLLLDSDVRYVVKVEGYAAYDPLELTADDLRRDLEAEMRDVVSRLSSQSAAEAETDVHRAFEFDLCPRCWRQFAGDPLAAVKAASSRGSPRGTENSEDERGADGDAGRPTDDPGSEA